MDVCLRILEIDRSHPIGKAALSGIKDITTESALTAILDMEDSVSAVDAEDKSKIYCCSQQKSL